MIIKRTGNYKTSFVYKDIKDNIIKDKNILIYIKSLKIPPAYNNVIINDINNNKKIIAFGYDSKNRKQVIYNQEYILKQHNKKYNRYLRLNKYIKKILKTIKEDLIGNDDYKKEIAIILFLLIECNFRIGNKKYLIENKTYGITTLEKRHIKFKETKGKDEIEIEFIGKKNIINKSLCKSKILYDYLYKKCKSLKNNENIFNVNSIDINKYLKHFNKEITSKDLRTWKSNNLYNKYIKNNSINEAIKKVSIELHNTPAVCKNSYIFIHK